MSWTSPRTWVALEVLTAALLNTHLRDNLLETAPAKVTTAGDIVYATGATALARLALSGTRGRPLRAGSSAPEYGGSGLYQIQRTSELGADVVVTATSLTDVAGLSVSITTIGGRLRVFLVAGAGGLTGNQPLIETWQNDAGLSPGAHVRAVVGANNLNVVQLGADLSPSSGTIAAILEYPISPIWEYTPGAGTYTVKIQASAIRASQSITFGEGARLVVEEWID